MMKKPNLRKTLVFVACASSLCACGRRIPIFSSESSGNSSFAPSSIPSGSSSSSQSSSRSSSVPSIPSTSVSNQSKPSSKYEDSPYAESSFGKEVYLNSIGDIFSCWDSYRGDGITLAVIDSGFDIDHPEFQNKDGTSKVLDTSCSFTTAGGVTTRHIGKENVTITDGDSHGTFCASVAAGSITGSGIVGIAPNADLMLLKTDKKPKSICDAFRYAADNGAKVITISIGSYSDYEGDLIGDGSDLTTCFNSATKYAHDKGVVICSAAGNGGGSSRVHDYTYPGAADYVIGCGGLAYNEDNVVWGGSSTNSGPEYVFCDIFAPSNNMYSGAYLNGRSTYDGGWDGTSFSSPQVAGAACLYFQKYTEATPDDFERDLYASAFALSDKTHTGHGRLNVGGLLGETIGGIHEVSFKTSSWWNDSGAATYCYMWSSSGNENANFPGAKVSSSFSIDLDRYETVILSRRSSSGEDWNARTVNLSASLLAHVSAYSIENTTATWYSSSGPVVGKTIA